MQIGRFFLVFIIGAIFGAILLYTSIFLGYFQVEKIAEISHEKTDSTELQSENDEQNLAAAVRHPILLYHHIQNPLGHDQMTANLSVSVENFTRQIAYLTANNYQIITLDSLFSQKYAKAAVITFDDGYKDIIENAYPVMQKYYAKGTVFIIASDVGKPGYLTWEDIKILQKDGWQIGSHTLTHPNLTNISASEAKNEIFQSKKIIENQLNSQVDFFCYPSGFYNQDIVELVKKAGYKGAVTTEESIQNNLSAIYRLKRIKIANSYSIQMFEEKISQ